MSSVSTPAFAYDDDDVALKRAREALDLPRLLARGWDPEMLIFAPPQSDAQFGWTLCERVGCARGGHRKGASRVGLCDGCHNNYVSNYVGRGVSVDEFKTIPYRATVRSIDSHAELCLVCRTPGHERRIRRRKLCVACASVQFDRGQTVEAYVNGDDRYPPAKPRPSLPPCEVVGCDHRTEMSQMGLCRTCHARFTRQRGRDPDLDLATFKRLGLFSVVDDGRTVDLSALPELVRVQFLMGLQRLIHLGTLAAPSDLALAARGILEQRIQDLRGVDHTKVAGHISACQIVSIMVEAAEDADATIDEELRRDAWRVRIIFPNDRRHRKGVLSFENVPQPWLRELAKLYCASRLGELRLSTLRRQINQIERFARFLAAAHRGETSADIDRHDLDRYISILHAHQKRGHVEIAALGHLLTFARRRGHTQGGAIAFGLRDDVVILKDDTKRRSSSEPVDEEPGRAIPDYVIAQLLEPEALARLHGTFAAAVELGAHTGRRPWEFLNLNADCLVYLESAGRDGKQQRPAIRYRCSKPPFQWVTLPIHEETAALIRRQQHEVQRRFLGIPRRELKLFPRPTRNPVGDQPITSSCFSARMREWVDALPTIVDDQGEPFDRSLIFPYALRHSYAQRHADNGTALDVLQKPMTHRIPQTTQGYYRVRDERLFEAVKVVGPLTINAKGERVPTFYPDADQLARSIGPIPVPLGYCIEPHNVKALGKACPFSHQCLGCTYFRSDPSNLPDLYAYLERLLEAQERLRAAVPELAEWARAKALPNDEEIKAVRNLIRSNEELLAELTPEQRGKLEELFRVLRAGRAVFALQLQTFG